MGKKAGGHLHAMLGSTLIEKLGEQHVDQLTDKLALLRRGAGEQSLQGCGAQ